MGATVGTERTVDADDGGGGGGIDHVSEGTLLLRKSVSSSTS